jgi:hypothetical protein
MAQVVEQRPEFKSQHCRKTKQNKNPLYCPQGHKVQQCFFKIFLRQERTKLYLNTGGKESVEKIKEIRIENKTPRGKG